MPLMQRTTGEDKGGLVVTGPLLSACSTNDESSNLSSETASNSSNNSSTNDDRASFYDAELTAPLHSSTSGSGSGGGSTTSISKNTSTTRIHRRRQQRLRLKRQMYGGMILVALLGLLFSIVGLPFPNRQLPELPPLPVNPRRAFATLHSDSNACYDMLLYVCVHTWKSTNSKYPMLLLHSVPLPPKVQALIDAQQPTTTTTGPHTEQERRQQQQQLLQQRGQVIPIEIPARKNYFVVKDRVRSAAAKFAVWDQTNYDQIAYHDSDTVFFENGDSIFDAPADETGNLYLYSQPYQKYWNRGKKLFNSGNFLIRPNKRVFYKILDLFHRRFWILSFHQFLKTADQGFLNAIFPWKTSWNVLRDDKLNHRVKHVKFWLAMAGDASYNITAQDQREANQIAKDLNLHDDLEACLHHRRYSS